MKISFSALAAKFFLFFRYILEIFCFVLVAISPSENTADQIYKSQFSENCRSSAPISGIPKLKILVVLSQYIFLANS